MESRETRSVEYKQTVTPTFLKTVSAFANYGTGKIVFGVDDDGHAIGLDDPIDACLRIENMMNDSLDPAVRYDVLLDDSARTVTLVVYEGRNKPYRCKGRAYRRNDSATIEVDRFEYGRLVLEGSNLTYDELTSAQQHLTFSVLDQKLTEALGIEGLNEDILRTLRLLDRDGYTNAAAILSDSNDLPGIDMVRFGPTNDVFLDRQQIVGVSALEQIDGALAMFERHYTYERIEVPARRRVERIPLEAYREAVANALVHRAWDVRANVQIAMYEDRIEITSPGSLPPGLTVERYLNGQVSVLRNPVVAEVFLKLRYIEKFGTGIDRIKRAYEAAPVQPAFDVKESFITVTLPVLDASPMTDDAREVLTALTGEGRLGRAELEARTGLTRARVLGALGGLVQGGLVEKIGEGRATAYRRV